MARTSTFVDSVLIEVEHPSLRGSSLEGTMHFAMDRRRLLFAMAGAIGTAPLSTGLRAAMGPNNKFDLLIKGGDVLDPSQRVARHSRHRHSQWRDRVGRSQHSGRACAESADRDRSAGDAGTDRPARAYIPVWLGDRHSGRRAGAVPGNDDRSVGRRCRSQQHRGVPPLHHAAPPARASMHSSTSPTWD